MARQSDERLWELDAVRGIAVVLMVVSNGIYDLRFIGFAGQLPGGDAVRLLARMTAGLFFLIAGVSLTLSFARAAGQGQARFAKYGKRGLKILALGMIVTAATRVAVPREFVVFGVLHLIGTGIILAYPFLGRPYASLAAAVLAAGAGFVLVEYVRVDFPWLLWAGFRTEGFRSIDYTPLFPWFGAILLGIFVGHLVYPDGLRRYELPDMPGSAPVKFLRHLGRHSLIIYLLHQPVLLGMFFVLRKLSV